MILKLTLAFVLLTAAFLVPTFAQTGAATEKQQAITELIALMNTDNRAEDILNAMLAQMDAMRDATVQAMLDERDDLTAADKRAMEEMFAAERKAAAKRFENKLVEKLNYNQMMNEIIAVVYAKHYTVEEIRELTAFYRTPTGRKLLQTSTLVMTDTMQLVQERVLPKIPIIIKEIQDEDRREIEQKINARKPKPQSKKSE